jgi:hypothetical protein
MEKSEEIAAQATRDLNPSPKREKKKAISNIFQYFSAHDFDVRLHQERKLFLGEEFAAYMTGKFGWEKGKHQESPDGEFVP